MHAAILSDQLGMEHEYSTLLENIQSNVLPYGECTDVSLSLIRGCRILLQKFRDGSSVDRSASIQEALGFDKQVAVRMDLGSSGNQSLQKFQGDSTIRTPIDAIGLMGQQISTVMSAEDIQNTENSLKNHLEKQLDGADLPKNKSLTYECLSVLAYQRSDYDLALEHLDRAMALLNGVGPIPREGCQKLKDYRHLLCRLTQQGPDLVISRCLISEKLSLLAYEKQDYDTALVHLERAISLSHLAEGVTGEQREKLNEFRAMLCRLKQAGS